MPAINLKRNSTALKVLGLATVFALGSCSNEESTPPPAPSSSDTVMAQPQAQSQVKPSEPVLSVKAQFWQALQTLCGHSYPGQLTIGTEESDREFGYAELSMHVNRCTSDEIDIGLSVDEDDSRTWMLRREDETLSLHHRHLDDNGKPDATSGYGGMSAVAGTPSRQEFPADDNTGKMIPAAATNVWAIEVVPDSMFAYELQRVEEQRMFRIVFDVREPLQASQ